MPFIVKMLEIRGLKEAGHEGKERINRSLKRCPLSPAKLTLAKDKCHLCKKIRTKSDFLSHWGK